MRILLTGATGFVGANLVMALNGRHTLAALLRPEAKTHRIPNLQPPITQLVWDGKTETMPALLASFLPDVIIHLAGYFVGVHKAEDIDQLIESNIRLPTILLESAIAVGCKQIIHVGSYWQHFENAIFAPVNLYASMKQAMADILTCYVQVGGLSKALTLELTDVYGPRDPRGKLIPVLQQAALKGEEIGLSPGDQYLDLLHIDDAVAGFLQALDVLTSMPERMEKRYALRSLKPVTLKEFVALFNEVSPHRVNTVWGARPYRPREMMQPWTSGEVLPGWIPKIDLRDGLRKLLEEIS